MATADEFLDVWNRVEPYIERRYGLLTPLTPTIRRSRWDGVVV